MANLTRTNEAQGLALMFAARANGVTQRHVALMARPYTRATDAQNILKGVNTNINTNIAQPKHIRLSWIVQPLLRQPDGRFFGVSLDQVFEYIRMVCEYVNRNSVPPIHLGNTIPVCAVIDPIYPGHPWPAAPAMTLDQWYTQAVLDLNNM